MTCIKILLLCNNQCGTWWYYGQWFPAEIMITVSNHNNNYQNVYKYNMYMMAGVVGGKKACR
jgi:hypothetical protein